MTPLDAMKLLDRFAHEQHALGVHKQSTSENQKHEHMALLWEGRVDAYEEMKQEIRVLLERLKTEGYES